MSPPYLALVRKLVYLPATARLPEEPGLPSATPEHSVYALIVNISNKKANCLLDSTTRLDRVPINLSLHATLSLPSSGHDGSDNVADVTRDKALMKALRAHCRASGLRYVHERLNPDRCIIFREDTVDYAALFTMLNDPIFAIRALQETQTTIERTALKLLCVGYSDEDVEHLTEIHMLMTLFKTKFVPQEIAASVSKREAALVALREHRAAYGEWIAFVKRKTASLLRHPMVLAEKQRLLDECQPYPPLL